MFEKLLDFDEVCLEDAVVEEERWVCPRSEVFELIRLPGHGEETTDLVIPFGSTFFSSIKMGLLHHESTSG